MYTGGSFSDTVSFLVAMMTRTSCGVQGAGSALAWAGLSYFLCPRICTFEITCDCPTRGRRRALGAQHNGHDSGQQSRGQERSSLVSGAGGCLGFSDGLIVPWVCWYFGAEASDHNFPPLLSLLDTLCGLAICIMTQALDDAPLACALSFPLLCAVQRCPGVT